MIKNIAILTSGGDAPGMNQAILAVAKTALKNKIQPWLVQDGFQGLIEKRITKATYKDLSGIGNRGGTIIGSARSLEFKKIEVQKEVVKFLNKQGIDALIVIGGDGSYLGAAKLSELGIKTIGLPGTIDNDIASTDFTIGYHSAIQEVVTAIDKIKNTTWSHSRCQVIEVMGRYCGDLTIRAAQATGVEVLVTPENPLTEKEIIEAIKDASNIDHKRNIIVLITEKMEVSKDTYQLAKKIEQQTKIETRNLILGNLQRGAFPVADDRILATILGVKAVESLLENKTGICLGIKKGEVVAFDIQEAVNMSRENNDENIRIAKLIA